MTLTSAQVPSFRKKAQYTRAVKTIWLPSFEPAILAGGLSAILGFNGLIGLHSAETATLGFVLLALGVPFFSVSLYAVVMHLYLDFRKNQVPLD